VTFVTATFTAIKYIHKKKKLGTTAIVILSVVIIHFVIGIGYLIYKLGDKKKDSISSFSLDLIASLTEQLNGDISMEQEPTQFKIRFGTN
jgi:hypothetical protein